MNGALTNGTTFFNNVAQFTGAIVVAYGAVAGVFNLFRGNKATTTTDQGKGAGKDDGVFYRRKSRAAWEMVDGRKVRRGHVVSFDDDDEPIIRWDD